MTEITLDPPAFEMMLFDAADVLADAAAAIDRVPGLELDSLGITVDETKPTTRMRVTGLDPATVHLESGTLENTKKPRTYSADAAAVTFTKLAFEISQRLDADFGAPDLQAELTHAERIAWDVQLIGRVKAAGVRVYLPKYRYDFRNRHGFADAVDSAFDRLLEMPSASFADILAISRVFTD